MVRLEARTTASDHELVFAKGYHLSTLIVGQTVRVKRQKGRFTIIEVFTGESEGFGWVATRKL